MKKEYKATNHTYTIELKEVGSIEESINNPPSYEPYKHIIKDLAPYMSAYSNWLVIRQALENLKAHDELTEGHTDHYGTVVDNIKSYVKTGKTKWDERE